MRHLALAALLAGCATHTSIVAPVEEAGAAIEATSAPSPTAAPPSPHRAMASKASRSRRPRSRVETGSPLSSTAYCETGLMANGHRTWRGAAAGNRWPLGTRLRVTDSPYGPGIYEVADRIGHGSSLDFAMPGDCDGARRWGRRAIQVEVVR